MERIKILVVDDSEQVRESVRQMLKIEEKFNVVGSAKNGVEAVELAERLKPDVILMDINMPEKDGITATEEITLKHPRVAIIILSAQGEQEYLRKAMAAGARDYLVKPFTPDQLSEAVFKAKAFVDKRYGVLEVEEPRTSRVISVFGTKGGVGKSVLAANLGVALKKLKDSPALIVDLNLEFGDIPLLFDTPVKHSLADISSPELLDGEILSELMAKHEKTGVDLLFGAPTPALAETVTSKIVDRALDLARDLYENVVIDLPGSFKDTSLSALDRSSEILLVTGLDLPTIKNTKLALDVMQSLEYPMEKVRIVLNRSDSQTGITLEDVEKGLGRKVDFMIPSDGMTVLPSVNDGEPFVYNHGEKPISKAIEAMASELLGLQRKEERSEKRKSLFPFLKRR